MTTPTLPPPALPPSAAPAATRNHTPPKRALMRHIRARMLAGIAVVAPLWITVVAVAFLFRIARSGSLWLIAAVLSSPIGAPILAVFGTDTATWQSSGLEALPLHGEWLVSLVAIALTATFVYAAGLVSMFVVGRRAIGLLERILERVPLVATIYGASKKVADSLTSEEKQPFQEVVLVPFPIASCRSIGFVTRRFCTPDGRPYVSVFVPTTPNPTSGFLLVVEPEVIQSLPMSVDEAIAAVMSGGVLFTEGQDIPISAALP